METKSGSLIVQKFANGSFEIALKDTDDYCIVSETLEQLQAHDPDLCSTEVVPVKDLFLCFGALASGQFVDACKDIAANFSIRKRG